MRVTLSKSKNAEQVYITRAFRDENGKSTSRIFKKLGTMADLLPEHDNNRDKVLAWAKEQARIYTLAEKEGNLSVPIELSEGKQLEFGEKNSFNGGYLFLQKMFHKAGLKKICDKVSRSYDFKYSLSDILSGLICARILSPSSKLSSFEYLNTLLQAPDFSLHDIYRALDVIDRESCNIQSLLYTEGKERRNTSVLYYDCTNFFFEVDEESELKKYGVSKEHRNSPIVQMGLFLDGDGLPLAFEVFPGNQSEQPMLIPLEKKIISDYHLSRFIICTDAGLSSYANRKFNDKRERGFVVTQSLKNLKSHIKEWALDPKGFYLGDGGETYDISKIDSHIYKDKVFHKERWINENGLEQRIVVSFSPSYREYQRSVRQRQVNSAVKILENGSSAATRNPNSPKRFIDEYQITFDGEIADKTVRSLDTAKISEEERYDGFYAVCTNLEDDIHTILKINRQRWEIEESFRIMKSEFKARPVYLQNDARIRAHFTVCFLSLYIYRMLEKELGDKYTIKETIDTLKSMSFHRVKGLGYLPDYTRSEVTDSLHEAFGFRTDKQIISDKTMKKIISATRK